MSSVFSATARGNPGPLSHNEWKRRYRPLREAAERIAASRNRRARKLCKQAGLDPDLLGIHPHNAMCSFEQGRPWRNVDYSLVRACLRELDRQFEGFRIVDRWDRRVRGIGGDV